MATSTNKGNQLMTFDHQNEASSLSFNKLLLSIIPPGIYKGGTLSIDGGTGKPKVSAMTAFLQTGNAEWANQVAVRVETQADYVVPEATSGTPWIVGRLNWASVPNNYMDITAVATPLATDIVFGLAQYTGATLTGFDLTDRSIVSRYADTLLLNLGLTSTPTGGTSTSLAANQTVYEALATLFARLIDLSGVQNSAVKLRHLDTGLTAGKVGGHTLAVGGADDLAFGGSAGAISKSAVLRDALTAIINALGDLSGTADNAVKRRHLSLGQNGTDLNASAIPTTLGQALGGTAPALVATDAISAALSKLATALKNLSGVDDSSVVRRHVNFGTGGTQVNASVIPMGAAISKNLPLLPANIGITAGETLPSAVGQVVTGLGNLHDVVPAALQAIDDLEAAVTAHTAAINQRDVFPIGAMMMYDGPNWQDNVTMPGWYACIADNAAKGCPDLEKSFLTGGKPGTKGTAYGVFGGFNQLVLAIANLPKHIHAFVHKHTISITGAGQHKHLASNGGLGDDGQRDGDTSTVADHTHPADASGPIALGGGTKNDTDDGGFANSALQYEDRKNAGTFRTFALWTYSAIYIRKCE